MNVGRHAGLQQILCRYKGQLLWLRCLRQVQWHLKTWKWEMNTTWTVSFSLSWLHSTTKFSATVIAITFISCFSMSINLLFWSSFRPVPITVVTPKVYCVYNWLWEESFLHYGWPCIAVVNTVLLFWPRIFFSQVQLSLCVSVSLCLISSRNSGQIRVCYTHRQIPNCRWHDNECLCSCCVACITKRMLHWSAAWKQW